MGNGASPFPRTFLPTTGKINALEAELSPPSPGRQVEPQESHCRQEQSLERSGVTRMDADHCVKLLERLGDTSDAIAQTLNSLGIQGVRNTVRFLNPIIRFLQSHIKEEDFELDLIQGTSVTATTRDRRAYTIPLPEAVLTFLDCFHRGECPSCEMPHAN